MREAMRAAHVRLGLHPWLLYCHADRRSRVDLRRKDRPYKGQAAAAIGYVPTVEYLNYAAPALALRGWMQRFSVVQIVSGFNSASLIPIVARKPFVSWIATPFLDEIESRYAAARPGVSVRVNYALRAANQRIERWTYRFPAHVFALSSYTARRLQEVARVPPSRMSVLRFPIDVESFRPDGPKWREGRRPYVLSVGRVDDERKNVASLVRCFAKVADKHREVDLVLAGQVKTDGAVVGLVRELGLGERVCFAGVLRGVELAAAYRQAEAYVMTSRQEGLGIVVLEAQASGLCCVLMSCGGSDELVDDGRSGWLVPQGDEEAFAHRLDHVLASRPHRLELGAAARNAVKSLASQSAFDAALTAVYRDVFRHEAASREEA
jgi:glycosyltransferase involved in cell wall biosynthesis